MSIEKKLWGNHNGKDCYLFTLENGNMTAEITNYAGSLVKLIVPDKEGNKGDILLGYDTLDGYIAGSSPLTGRNILLPKTTTVTRFTAVMSASIRRSGMSRITAKTTIPM